MKRGGESIKEKQEEHVQKHTQESMGLTNLRIRSRDLDQQDWHRLGAG